MTSALIPLHMGALHAYEQWLVAAIAFGPFIILGIVIAIRRRQDLSEETEEAGQTEVAAASRIDAEPVDVDDAP